jgi:threonine dehydrogenase-like Zn-dependent dehydrogenase
LVIGGGPIGQAAALAARRLGATRIMVSEPDPRRRQLVAGLGFTCVDPNTGDIATVTGDHLGEPATVVLDAVGTSATLAGALECVALGGRVVLVGMNEPSLNMPAYAVSTKERSVVGSFCYDVADFAQTASWVAEQAERLAPLIDGAVDLDGAADAFQRLADGSLRASKVLIYPHGITESEEER